jgi:hypothetical protein
LQQQGGSDDVRNVHRRQQFLRQRHVPARLHRSRRPAHQGETDRAHDGVDVDEAIAHLLRDPTTPAAAAAVLLLLPQRLSLGRRRQPIAYDRVGLDSVDKYGHGDYARLLHHRDEIEDVPLLGYDVLPIQ